MFIQAAQLIEILMTGEMFSIGQQCQLSELVLRLDWKAKDMDKRHVYLEFRLIAFIMTAGKKYSLKLVSDWWSCKVRSEVCIINSIRNVWVVSVLTILDSIPPLKNRLLIQALIRIPLLPTFNNQGGQESFTAGMHPYNISRLHQFT